MWTAILLTFQLSISTFASDGSAAGESPLDGKPKSFVIVGYSTSFLWPTMYADLAGSSRGEARRLSCSERGRRWVTGRDVAEGPQELWQDLREDDEELRVRKCREA